ncbi:MAG: glycine cleavage T C-terminal barrel domain-containing protein, partial [Phycisphaeraceae bacterium]|nr:glycine cleavage T C-terminal barrel domain-containing protein [Phycisphaeraceae bacterium]
GADEAAITRAAEGVGQHHVVEVAGKRLSMARRDLGGAMQLVLMPEADAADELYLALAEAGGGLVPDVEAGAEGGGAKRSVRGRGIGWLAINTARIEAGRPLYHVDFGPDSLPAETGCLDEAVSFTKGCYIGQEVVARMQNLGHPKRKVVGLTFADGQLPIAGTGLMDEPSGDVIGGVTSSTPSPMNGGEAIALGTVKWGFHEPGTEVYAAAEGSQVVGTVRESLGVL